MSKELAIFMFEMNVCVDDINPLNGFNSDDFPMRVSVFIRCKYGDVSVDGNNNYAYRFRTGTGE